MPSLPDLQLAPGSAPSDALPARSEAAPAPPVTLSRMAKALAHEIDHPSEVVQGNGQTLAAYAEVFRRLFEEYETCLHAFGAKDRTAITESRHRINALRKSEDLAFIAEDLPELVEESRRSAERLRDLAERLREIGGSTDDGQCGERVAALIEAADATAGSE